MSDSWRITVNEIDQSQTVNVSPGNTGAMVLRSSKGPIKPIYVSVADERRIIDIFGKPSATHPDVWEAIQYNREAPLWISAPYAPDATLSGVVVTSTGTVALNETDGIDPDSLTDHVFAGATEYFVLASISPYAEDLGVKVTYDETSELFTIALYRTSDSGSTWTLLDDTYRVSAVADTKDGFGKNVFVEQILGNDPLTDDYLQAYANSTANVTGFVDDTNIVALGGGDRGAAITITQLTTAWNYFQKPRTYAADIFMDTTNDDGIPDLFKTLRETYQPYSFYIMPLPAGEDATAAIATKAGYSINNRGLAFYWNRGRVRDTYNNSSFWTSLIGRVGRKFAQMVNVYNGLAPSWTDENGHGGQLGGGILELEFDPSESQLETLDSAGVNPIVFSPAYGVMIVSQKTAKTPSILSDDSWIAHSRLFDLIISTIKEQVLVFQITKLNDDLHRQLAYSKCDQILSPMAALGLLSEYGVQCDRGNNTDAMLAARKFILTVAVKVTVFSETIVLNFVKVGATLDVSQFVG